MKKTLKSFAIAGLIIPLLAQSVPVQARDVSDRFRDELWYLDQIQAPAAWDVETGAPETIVAVLDAGFDLDHEDLTGQYWENDNEIAGNTTDNDGNGFEDDVQGWDFVDNDPDPSPDVIEGGSDTVLSHGTVIAGIIGATANNGIGIAGINWDVSIMPLRVLNEFGAGSTAAVREAIIYAVENGADVINLSVSFTQTDARLRETIEWAHDQGVVIVAAVGNGNTDTDIDQVYPACFDTEIGRNIVIGVAATDQYGTKADFSNFGTRCTDLSAPGEDIFATVYHDAQIASFSTSYASPWEGTSLAAPMVTAAAALIRSSYPALTPDQVRQALKLAVDPVAEPSLEARMRLGAGVVNVARALEYAAVFAGDGTRTSTGTTHAATESIVVAQGSGSQPMVRRMNGRGEILAQFEAYHPDFNGGVRLAMGDVDGDGEVEIVTGAGPSGGPQVRIFSLQGEVEGQFFAFDEEDRSGITVAVGDINQDGVEEIVVGQDAGGTGQVRMFNRYGDLKGAFFPQGRTEDAVEVTLVNIDTDPALEIVTASGSMVAMHEGTGRYIRSFSVFDGRARDVHVAGVSGSGQNIAQIFVSAGSGHNPSVSVYNELGQEVRSFFAFPPTFEGGVALSVGDIDGNGKAEVYATPVSGGPQVRIFSSTGTILGSFFAFDPQGRFGARSAIDL